MNLFSNEDERKLVIDAYNDYGFIVNGVYAHGAQILFSTLGLFYNVTSFAEVGWDS